MSNKEVNKANPENGNRHKYLELVLTLITSFIATYALFVAYIVFFYLMYSRFWCLGLFYVIYIINDGVTPAQGGRIWKIFKKSAMWRHCANYFPIKLIKTAELDPSKNYLALCYPHGVIMQTQFIALHTNGLKFNETFSGLTSYLAQASVRLTTPFVRDFFMSLGGIFAIEDSLIHVLDSKRYNGNFVVLNTGGSAEANLNRHDNYTIVLKNRKGWARIAIKSGASIVPVFCFGENKIYNSEPYQTSNGFLNRLMEKLRMTVNIAPVLPKGVPFLCIPTFLPYRRPVHVVVGAPIDVQQNSQPSLKEVNVLHAKLVQSLQDLFEAEKSKYEDDPNIQLNII